MSDRCGWNHQRLCSAMTCEGCEHTPIKEKTDVKQLEIDRLTKDNEELFRKWSSSRSVRERDLQQRVYDRQEEIEALKADIDTYRKSTKEYFDRAEKAEAERGRLRLGLTMLLIGSCNCLTKTDDIQYHQDYCLYKKIQTLLNHKEG